mgnify:CR=1 FL=1
MIEEYKPQRGMVVVAHADDAEWSCSGTVALWCRDGMEVTYVVCTDGSKGSDDPEMTSERLVAIRKQEQLDAAKVLGVKDVVFLGYEDAILSPTIELRRDISRQIRKFRPDVLITLDPSRSFEGSSYVGHPDHMAAGEAALSATFPAARDRLTFPELRQEGLETHKVRELLIVGIGSRADKWIDVTDTIDTTIAALLAHSSQIGPEVGDRVREWRRETGKAHGMEYAEAFKSFTLR